MRRFFILSAMAILSSIACMANDKPKFVTLDNEWFTCEFVDGWKISCPIPDGDIFQEERLWHRNSPDKKGEYAISIRYYDKSKVKKYSDYYKQCKQLPIETPVDNLKYHCIQQLIGSISDPFMSESWVFITNDCLIEVGYQYRKNGDVKFINKYREIAKRTVNTLKIK